MKDIIIALAKHLESGVKIEEWVGLDTDRFLSHGKTASKFQLGGTKPRRARYNSLFIQREFDSRYVLSVGDPFWSSKLTVASQKLERRGHLLTHTRAKVTQQAGLEPTSASNAKRAGSFVCPDRNHTGGSYRTPPPILLLTAIKIRWKNNDGLWILMGFDTSSQCVRSTFSTNVYAHQWIRIQSL